MNAQSKFERSEQKYLMTKCQMRMLKQLMAEYMVPDTYGATTIGNLYYDTADYRLIRRSLEKPIYKEKLRVRSYGLAKENAQVYVELKKKYEGIVYKRRLSLRNKDVPAFFSGAVSLAGAGQIVDEIDYFRRYYGHLVPAMAIYYYREAYFDRFDSSFRVTFDTDIVYRTEQLTLEVGAYGEQVLSIEQVLMEVKTVSGLPIWLTQFLTSEGLYKISFSKYGCAYQKTSMKGGHGYVA